MTALDIYNLKLFLGTFVLSLAVIAVFENCGFWFEKALRLVLKRFDSKSETPKWGWELRILIGSLIYGMLNFWIGVARISFAPIIFYTAVAILALTLFWRIYKVRLRLTKFSIFKVYRFFRKNIAQNWTLYLGVIILYLFVFRLLFRPVTQFDGVWYHIPIPKFFLQEGNIDYRGPVLRYWVHPYINFFWNMLPLSIPELSIPAKSIVINLYTFNFTLIGILYSLKIFVNEFKMPRILLAPGIFLLFVTAQSLFAVGLGYNDLFTVGIAAALITHILKCLNQSKLTKWDLIIIVLLSVELILLKIFFAIFAFIIFSFVTYYFFKSESSDTFRMKLISFIIICSTSLVLFVLPWLIRSKLQTGRWLDPIGAPGINEDAYSYAGSLSADNHWGNFVFNRFYTNFPKIFVELYTPLFAVGSIAILNKSIRLKFGELWAVSFLGFWTVYFISIVTEWRYFFPSVTAITIFGLLFINLLWQNSQKYAAGILIFASIGFGWYSMQRHYLLKNEMYRDMYIEKGVNMDVFLSERLGLFTPSYYPSSQAPKPKDINPDDKIYVTGIVHTAYIYNPIITYNTHSNLFKGAETIDEFVSVLKQNGIRYILSRERSMPLNCNQIGIKNFEECSNENNNYWEIETIDQKQASIWYKLK